MKRKNKNAQIFTILAIILISLMFLSFELFSFLHQTKSTKTRISTMDSFLSSTEENFARQIYISGFRIIFLAEDQITSTGNYINVNDFFQEAFFNGTVNGAENNAILTGTTYDDLVNSLNNKVRKINVNITLENSNLTVTQNDPWNVNVTLTSNFIMSDREGLARWDKVQTITSLIPITFFEDPLFTVNSYAKVSRKISQTPYEGIYNDSGDIANLILHVNGKYYATNPNAPNFLNRLEGNFSADPNGIESFIYIPDFTAQGLTIYDKTMIDYIYFNPSRDPTKHTVSGMPLWFKIDSEDNHTEKYGA